MVTATLYADLVGRENAATGAMYHGFIPPGVSSFAIFRYDNNPAVTTGWMFYFSGVFEVQ